MTRDWYEADDAAPLSIREIMRDLAGFVAWFIGADRFANRIAEPS
jgi:hypothetical protein